MSARLADLFPEAAGQATGDAADLTVLDLTADSRQVATGTVFVAVPGTKADGRRFAAPAATRGAVAVAGETPNKERLVEQVLC